VCLVISRGFEYAAESIRSLVTVFPRPVMVIVETGLLSLRGVAAEVGPEVHPRFGMLSL